MMDFFVTGFGNMFKPIADGGCRLGVNGEIAVKTSNGYKTFDVKRNKLINCSDFAFDIGNMFWVVPTFKVKKGDIILVNNTPRRVMEVGKNSIKAFSYENSTIEEIIPEHHVFMGKTYCYGKIFSPFSDLGKKDGAMSSMMQMIMMSRMFGGDTKNSNMMNGMNPMMFMMMNQGDSNPFMNMFDGAFDFGSDDSDDDNESEE